MPEQPRYDAFMSYSHALDGTLAPTLQRALERFAKRWNRARAMRVFRDNASLSANPGLWSSIERALAHSDWFVLLASPEAARSIWVNREVSWWLENRSAERIILVVTGGELYWDERAADFDWVRSTAVPEALRGAFKEEPREVDLRWLRDVAQVDESNPQLRECAADIASTVRGVPKDRMIGEHIRQHRRTMRLARAGVSLLALLLVVATVAAATAWVQAELAQQRAKTATSRALAAESRTLANRDPRLAALTAVMAHRLDPTAQSATALMQGVDRLRHVTRFLHHPHRRGELAAMVEFSPDGTRAALTMKSDGGVRLWNLDTGVLRVLPAEPVPNPPRSNLYPEIRFSADGRRLVSVDSEASVLAVWDARTGRSVAKIPTVNGASLWGVSQNGRFALLGVYRDGMTELHAVDLENRDGKSVVLGTEDQFPVLDGHRTVTLPGGMTVRFPVREDVTWLSPDLPPSVFSADRSAEVDFTNDQVRWRDQTGRPLAEWEVPASDGKWSRLAVSGDGSVAVLGDDRGRVVAVQRQDGRVSELAKLPNSIQAMAVDRTGKRVLIGDAAGNAVVAEPHTDARFTELPGTKPNLGSAGRPDTSVVDASPDGRWLVVSRSHRVELWNLAGRRLMRDLPGFMGFSADSRTLAVRNGDTVDVLRLPDLSVVQRIPAGKGHVAEATALARALGQWQSVSVDHPRRAASIFDQTPRMFVAVDGDGHRWELTSGRYPDRVSHPSGALLTADSDDSSGAGPITLTSWDRSAAEPTEIGQRTVDGDAQAISPDGQYVVVSGPQGTRVTDMTDPNAAVPFVGGYGRGSLFEYAFTANADVVVQHVAPQREEDTFHNRLLFWHRPSGTLIGEWEEPEAARAAGDQPVSMVPAGNRVTTIRPNGGVAVWQAGPEAWARHLCALVGPPTAAEREQFLSGFDVGTLCG